MFLIKKRLKAIQLILNYFDIINVFDQKLMKRLSMMLHHNFIIQLFHSFNIIKRDFVCKKKKNPNFSIKS